MKKIVALLLILVMSISICACGSGSEKQGESAEQEEVEEQASVMSNDYFALDGICVDDSYSDEDESPLRPVYLFYTLNANDQNLEIDSVYTTLTIGDNNSYESEFFPTLCNYASSYYYSSYIEDVYTGSSLKVVTVFMIPESDLEAGKSVKISDSQIPEIESIEFMTDEIQHFDGEEALIGAIDPEGYAEAMSKREEADETKTKEVKSYLNGYYWQFYVNNTSYDIEFWEDNNFEVRTAFGTNGGTYSVRNGYIFCTYSSNGAVVEIPYAIEGGEIDLDVTTAFDVKSN